MPVYEFKCDDCGHRFDIVATLAEKDAGLSPTCPRCSGKRVRQLFGRFTVLAGSKTESDDFDAGDFDDETGGAGDDEFGDDEFGDEEEDFGEDDDFGGDDDDQFD
jgi:putative FmdB family regulatory protein